MKSKSSEFANFSQLLSKVVRVPGAEVKARNGSFATNGHHILGTINVAKLGIYRIPSRNR